MSLNIAPPTPHNIVNAAAPSTESLARANAIKEVVPAPVQVEAAVPQKSREQDTRGPQAENPTYDSIKQQSDSSIIPDDPLGENPEDAEPQGQQAQDDSAGEEANESAQADGKTNEDGQSQDKERAIERAEQAQQELERKEIQQLERRDDEVRAHEQAHASVGGGYAGTPRYQYETGPNGQKYAVSGEVSIDVSKEATPQDTIQKMQTVRAAALAPAEPSSQDRKVAAEASQKIVEARAELIRENAQKIDVSERSRDGEELEINTDSHVAEEPSKRSLAGQGVEPAGTSNPSNVSDNESATLAHGQPQASEFASSKVIQSRYIQSYQSQTHLFNAVA